MSAKPAERDYQSPYPEGSLFSTENDDTASSSSESLPTIGPKRPLRPEEASAQFDVLSGQFNAIQARERTGTSDVVDEERNKVHSISQKLVGRPHPPSRSIRVKGDGIQQPGPAADLRIPRARTQAEAQAAKQAMEQALGRDTPPEAA